MKLFFTSDTHFGSNRVNTLSKRPFKSVQEMDQSLIKNWNSVVSNDDIVFHIGDFGNFEVLKQLNGNIVIILGNYEKKEMSEKFNNNFNLYKNYLLDLGFKEVYEDCLKIKLADKIVNLTHEPKNCVNTSKNLFGHIHKLQLVKPFGLNVGIDCHNFTPINESDVIFYLNCIENVYDENVFCVDVAK